MCYLANGMPPSKHPCYAAVCLHSISYLDSPRTHELPVDSMVFFHHTLTCLQYNSNNYVLGIQFVCLVWAVLTPREWCSSTNFGMHKTHCNNMRVCIIHHAVCESIYVFVQCISV